MINHNTSTNHVIFTENGAPYSTQFDDIYFDSEQGYFQSQVVFIEGNKVSEQLLNASKTTITIAETGFGTGLNFLLTLKLYQQLLTQTSTNSSVSLPKLHFISTEKYPLTKVQLTQALAAFPELSSFSEPLIDQYPDHPNNTCSWQFFQQRVQLTLLINDASNAFSSLNKEELKGVDIWYLDGFSPKKNPDMWSEALFQQMARLSNNEASIATFTVAGFVRRGLQQVGFRLKKQQSGGKKKEILIGKYQIATPNKGYQIRPTIKKPQQVTIIGGGIASACAAYALTKQGIKVVLYTKDDNLAQGASSNAIGALFPLIHQQPDNLSNFYQQAFWHAKAFYQNLLEQGYYFSHQWCGLLDIAYKESIEQYQQHFAELNCWPQDLVHKIDANMVNTIANIKINKGALYFPHAGWIAPQECVQQLFNAAKATQLLKIKYHTHIESISQNEDKSWCLHTVKDNVKGNIKENIKATTLLLCGGADAIKIKNFNSLPLTSIRGQVSSMPVTQYSQDLKTVLCHKGYVTPAHNEQHCIGATFERNNFNTTNSIKEDQYNLTMLEQCLPNTFHWQLNEVKSSKARLRCVTPDHLPIVGALPNIAAHKKDYAHLSKDKNWRISTPASYQENLYVLTGLGARGLCSAPLLADILVADLCGTPYPVSQEMLFNLAANRFIIRDIIRRKV